MNTERLKRLQSAGWRVGSVGDFLNLEPAEVALVEIKVSLINALKSARARGNLSQVALAQRMKSSQSRVAKIEAGDPSVSLDLIVRALIATGASKRDIQNAFAARVTHATQGIVYLPIPIAGLLTLLFLIERIWVGAPPKTSIMYSDKATELEQAWTS